MLYVPKQEIEAIATQLLPDALNIAQEAGDIIMDWRGTGYKQYTKADDSIITEADEESSQFIVSRLTTLTPDFCVMSEENDIDPDPDAPYWSIDPLDGTKVFASGGTGFAVNMALIINGSPVLGVVNCPAHDTMYYSASGIPSYKKHRDAEAIEIRTRSLRLDKPPHTLFDGMHAHEQSYNNTQRELSARFDFALASNPATERPMQLNLLVAEGKADIHVKTGKECEKDGTPRPLTERAGYSWDNAADRIIVKNAGGCIIDIAKLFGVASSYNGRTRHRESAYMAFGDGVYARRKFPAYAITD